MTVGFTLSMVPIGLFLAIGWNLSMPLLLGVTDVFDHGYGIVHFQSVADGFLLWSHAALAAALWWFGAPWLMRVRARLDRALLGPTESERVRLLRERVDTLAETRSEAVDIQAAELRRIERDLHDGAQARLVSSGMTLGMAIDVLDDDPEAARAMLKEAQTTTRDALADLRGVVRGIHPPVLADRGLVGAVRALAEQMALPVQVMSDLGDRRPPAPVESAAYFAIAECLTNIGKHAHATHALVGLGHDPAPDAAQAGTLGVLSVVVEDDGVGGARRDPEGGLAGIERRLAVFDGTLDVSSPAGGPTQVAMTLPCDLSE
jgi:signal transduction histidine kinase